MEARLNKIYFYYSLLLEEKRVKEILYKPIGIIHSPYKTPEEAPQQPELAENGEAIVEVFSQYRDGLLGIERFEQIVLISHFHLSERYALQLYPRGNRTSLRGVFATRAPRRPNPIGLSVVRLLKVDGRNLIVENIDLVDGTPVLDIKPFRDKISG